MPISCDIVDEKHTLEFRSGGTSQTDVIWAETFDSTSARSHSVGHWLSHGRSGHTESRTSQAHPAASSADDAKLAHVVFCTFAEAELSLGIDAVVSGHVVTLLMRGFVAVGHCDRLVRVKVSLLIIYAGNNPAIYGRRERGSLRRPRRVAIAEKQFAALKRSYR